MAKVKPNSVDEALAAWDRGDEVETVEMGGLGDGYEMAIQCVAFELMRTLRDDPKLNAEVTREIADGESFADWLGEALDAVVQTLDAKQPDGSHKLGGLSGAQVGAAKSMAVNLTRHGWDNARRQVPERMIFVRKQDPRTLYQKDAA